MNKKVKVDITVSDCTECPYYYGMMREGLFYTYGKCEKTGGVGENRNLISNCPYKRDNQDIMDYIETDHKHFWKLRIVEYIDDIIHERLERILKDEW